MFGRVKVRWVSKEKEALMWNALKKKSLQVQWLAIISKKIQILHSYWWLIFALNELIVLKVWKNASAELKKQSVKTMSTIVIINVTQSAMIIIHFWDKMSLLNLIKIVASSRQWSELL